MGRRAYFRGAPRPMFRGRRAHARPRLAGARRRLHPRQPPRPRARRAERRSGTHRGAGGRSPHGCGRLLPQSGSRARAGLEPEAARGLRGAGAARAWLPVPHGGLRQPARSWATSGTATSGCAGTATPRSGRRISPRSRRDVASWGIRRVDGAVIADESWFDARPGRPGLEARLLHPGVAAAVGARRRPRTLPRAHIPESRTRRCVPPPAGAGERRRHRGGAHAGGRSHDDRSPTRAGCLRAPCRHRSLHGPRERQLHGGDAREAARGGLRRPRVDSSRRARRAGRSRGGRRSRSPASGSPTDRACPVSTG